MIKNYLLLTLSFILSFTVFAQRTEHKNNRHFTKSRVESQLQRLNKKNNDSRHNQLFIKNKNAFKKVSQGNIKQRLDSLVEEEWNETTNQWIIDYKGEFIYNSNGSIIQEFNYDWNETTSQWDNAHWKGEYAYDTNENIIQEIYYEGWNQTTKQWDYIWKYESTYDTNENMIQYISYDWSHTANQWVIDDKKELSYDSNGNATILFNYEWSETNNQWDNADWKVEYSHDASGNRTQYLYYDWKDTTNQWTFYSKDEYTYDTNGNLTLILEFRDWNETTSQWDNADWKEEYTYDANENAILSFRYYWNKTTNQWDDAHRKFELNYDNTFSFSDLILPLYYTEEIYIRVFFNHLLTNDFSYDWDETSNNWVKNEKHNFYYSEQNTLSVSEIKNSEFNVFPNPAFDKLNIDSKLPIIKVGFYSIMGLRVKEVDTNFNSIPTHDLTSGIYLLRIESENGFAVKKLIKQ